MGATKPVYVVSAPSGAGKTTLNRMLCSKHPEVEICISLTTRTKRADEVNGKDYDFVSSEQFLSHVNRDELLEWANVHGHLYGTSKNRLNEIENRGHTALLEIDVQGWENVRRKLRNAVSIFILPPSLTTLWDRLEKRGTDDEKVRWRRLLGAKREIERATGYDYFIVNDEMDRAYLELERIIIDQKPGTIGNTAGVEMCRKLLNEFNTSKWLSSLALKFPDKG